MIREGGRVVLRRTVFEPSTTTTVPKSAIQHGGFAMFGTVVVASLFLVPAQGRPRLQAPPVDDKELAAWSGDSDSPLYKFTSACVDKGPKQGAVITDTMSNGYTDSWLWYAIRRGGNEGRLPTAGQTKDGKTLLRSMTAVRTTYRQIEEITDSVALFSDKVQEEHTATRWLEAGPGPWAEPGRSPLEAKLIEGDAKGKVLVRCASDVSGDKDKGYTYTYTVENRSDKPVQFKWAGFEGKIEPGKSFTKTQQSKEQTREESGRAEFDFGDHKEFTIPAVFAIPANLWGRPK